jgi:hypothetical protein
MVAGGLGLGRDGPGAALGEALGGRRREAPARHGPLPSAGFPEPGDPGVYLEPFEDGTVVSCLLEQELTGGSPKVRQSLRRARSEVRKGGWSG